MINISIETNKFWKKYTNKNLNLWIKGYFYSHKIEDIIGICENIKTEDISNFLDSIDGHFALVLQRLIAFFERSEKK